METIRRSIVLLKQFSREAPRLSAYSLAQSAGISAALSRRMLDTMQRHGLVRSVGQSGGDYELGLAWLRLADVRRRQLDVRRIALPIMRRMRDAVNETVILAIRAGSRRVNIDYVESTQAIRRLTQLGFEAPLHIGASGRALLAGLDAEQFEHYSRTVPLISFAAAKPLAKAKLAEQLQDIRRQGYAVALREITSDTAAVAAPVCDHTGETVAAISISCPEDRFTPRLKERCIEQVLVGAREVSTLLGYSHVGPDKP